MKIDTHIPLLTAIQMVKSLSSSEKRFFKMRTKKFEGEKKYLWLFELIDKSKTAIPEQIVRLLPKSSKKSDVDNSARYLIRLLTDCLVEMKISKDPGFWMLHGLMRMKVLHERSLYQEAFRLGEKVKCAAPKSELGWIAYISNRLELNYYVNNNFAGIDERKLIEIQMQAKDNIRNLNRIQEYHSLFEILKFRLVHRGRTLSAGERKELNDLMLAEMALASTELKKSFTVQKLHLLFQSFFLTDIGDYKSALKTFRTLNKLFEENIPLLEHPPLDYLFALDGILDSLCTVKIDEERAFYLEKMTLLDAPVYPEYFRYRVRKTVAVYRLRMLTNQRYFSEAVKLTVSFGKGLINNYNMVDEEKQWELYFYCSLAHFGKKEWNKAHRYMAAAMHNHLPEANFVICKAIRLLSMMIYYEKKDWEYLKYEIKSCKKLSRNDKRLLRCESLLVNYLNSFPSPMRKKLPEHQQRSMQKEIQSIRQDAYERQLLKYFDFTEWIEGKMQPVA